VMLKRDKLSNVLVGNDKDLQSIEITYLPFKIAITDLVCACRKG
jgi:allophanate hydrolase subunit 2